MEKTVLTYEQKIAIIANQLQEKYHLEDKRVDAALDIIFWGRVTIESTRYPKTYRVSRGERQSDYKNAPECLVNIDDSICECGDFVYRNAVCKHRIAAGIMEEYHKQYPAKNGNSNVYIKENGEKVIW